ncbi:MAG: SIR2 family protein [Aquabacterium sp.]|uniref:SIR2 family protein n=1 Tax=Aquabacterium sp. TaxID=1872578 RepID=UPI0025B8706F|nr:SIR2 family protein [Aquabacterium sp.]MBI5925642.1 SIR2 family protein [Aquabacterium sp.]
MRRSIIIFGNGLGMSLDSNYFPISAGLASVWSGSEYFKAEHKDLIKTAIPGLTEDTYPSTEEQLDDLQVAIVASEYLRGFETDKVKWLTDQVRELPEAFRRFIHEVAAYYQGYDAPLPLDFRSSLANYLRSTKSHVATLNYDNLLYDGLKGYEIFEGYNGVLIDGFHRNGFDPDNLNRIRGPRSLGWYLHLHGSPLFVGNQKLMGGDRAVFTPDEKSHIVLTHVTHKPLVIESSSVLSEYWKRLNEAIQEVEYIVIFGYSGTDSHLNELLSQKCTNKQLYIIEWSGTGDLDTRCQFWQRILRMQELKLIHMTNILCFTAWCKL